MRRQLRRVVPELAHYFGVRPWEIDELTYGEIDELLRRLRTLPPIGGVVMMQPAKG